MSLPTDSQSDFPLTLQQRRSCMDLVRVALGLVFPPTRESEFDASMKRASARLTGGDMGRLLALLEGTDAEAISVVAEEVTVPESHFFRIGAHFEFLSREIRHRLALGRSVKIWSVGCARGEEAYTAAIVALEAMNGVDDGRVQVLASDVNSAFLRSAMAAEYRPWAFRGVSRQIVDTWFESVGELRRPIEPVRRVVRFFSHNLANRNPEKWPNGVDVILCRNVLIYFDLEGALEVGGRLATRLAPEGWLLTAPSDPLLLSEDLATDVMPGFVAYRRRISKGVSPSGADPQAFEHGGRPPLAPPDVPSASGEATGEKLRAAREAADRNDFAQAEACLKDHLDAFPLDAAALLLTSIVALARGDAERAGHAAERAAHISGELAMAHVIAAASWARSDHRHRSLNAIRAARDALAAFDAAQVVPESGGSTAAELHDTILRLEAAILKKEGVAT